MSMSISTDTTIINPINKLEPDKTNINAKQQDFNLASVNNLVLSGGGMLGISYIGLYKILEENDAKKQIKTITGCSAGAIFGSFLALGYTSKELLELVHNIQFNEYLNITAESLLNVMKNKGLDSGNMIMKFIIDVIRTKTGNESITLLEVYQQYGITLRIGITNLTKSQFQLIDYHNSPNMPLYKAINASIAIPFIFEPVIIDDEVFCDGGLLDNLPMDYILDGNNNITSSESKTSGNTPTTPTTTPTPTTPTTIKTLGIYLSNTRDCPTAENYKDMTVYQYLGSVFHALNLHPTNYKKSKESEKKYKIIIIEIPCDIMTFLKINATSEDIDNIVNIAYNTISKQCLSAS